MYQIKVDFLRRLLIKYRLAPPLLLLYCLVANMEHLMAVENLFP